MTRRNLLALLTLAQACRAVPRRTVLFICMDGCDPRYLAASDIPNLRRMMHAGMYREGRSVMPSVTDVNNASIATGSFPSEHGITGNYYFNRATGLGTYMEAPEFLRRPSIFVKASEQGYRTAFVCAKDKLRPMIGQGASRVVSAELAPEELRQAIGPKPEVYSPDLNYWAFRAARHLLRNGYNFVFLSTTDYMMHTYAPEDAPSLEHMHEVDKLLGAIADDHPSIEIYFTADHGMNAKSKALDIGRFLTREGIAAEAVPIIKDRYVKHHSNLGGSSYIYVKNPKDIEKTASMLAHHPAIEQVLSNQEAAREFSLMPERIGDLLALAKKDWVVGDLDAIEEDVKLRSHGSLHETSVPILCFGRKVRASEYEYNFDLTRRFEW